MPGQPTHRDGITPRTIALLTEWKGEGLHPNDTTVFTDFAQALEGELTVNGRPVTGAAFAEACVVSAIEADAGYANTNRALAYLSSIANDCIRENRMPGSKPTAEQEAEKIADAVAAVDAARERHRQMEKQDNANKPDPRNHPRGS